MRVSIITICRNRVRTIEKAIQSVLNQDYRDIEYIIIDGDSTDGTQQIIEKYSNMVATFISEPDKGMYDAINKGIAAATGDIIGLMHSDDEFYDNKVVSQIVQTFVKERETEGVYGNGIYISNDHNEKIIRNRIGGEFSLDKIKNGWLPLHPTVYIKRDLIEKYGMYNLNYNIASDTEFLLRYIFKFRIHMTYVNCYFVKMRIGGLSTSRSRAVEVFIEDLKIYKYHKLPALITVFRKKLYAFKQYL